MYIGDIRACCHTFTSIFVESIEHFPLAMICNKDAVHLIHPGPVADISVFKMYYRIINGFILSKFSINSRTIMKHLTKQMLWSTSIVINKCIEI